MDRLAFRSILLKSSSGEIMKILARVPLLKILDRTQLNRLADILTEVRFKDGDFIIRQGDVGETFFVIINGEVVITKDLQDTDADVKEIKGSPTALSSRRVSLEKKEEVIHISVKLLLLIHLTANNCCVRYDLIQVLLKLGQNSYFGERALLSGEKRAANVKAIGRVDCYCISRSGFEEVLGPLQNILDADIIR